MAAAEACAALKAEFPWKGRGQTMQGAELSLLSLFPSSLLCKLNQLPKQPPPPGVQQPLLQSSPLQHGVQDGGRSEFCGHSMWWQEPSWLWSPQRLPGDLVIQRGSGQGEAGGQPCSKCCLFLASAHVATTGESFTAGTPRDRWINVARWLKDDSSK